VHDDLRVLDRAVHEREAVEVAHVVEVLLAPRVGELVEDDDLLAQVRQPLTDEVRADEAGATADQQPHETTSVIDAAARSRR
jgi:hypothetical protein